jgi:hypothetical protein
VNTIAGCSAISPWRSLAFEYRVGAHGKRVGKPRAIAQTVGLTALDAVVNRVERQDGVRQHVCLHGQVFSPDLAIPHRKLIGLVADLKWETPLRSTTLPGAFAHSLVGARDCRRSSKRRATFQSPRCSARNIGSVVHDSLDFAEHPFDEAIE